MVVTTLFFEGSRKVQVFGSSMAMTLPALFVKACEIEKGTELDVIYGLDGVLVVSSLKEPEALRDSLLLIGWRRSVQED
jgi:antitoxin component of MazEF toxin-antitoxin module